MPLLSYFRRARSFAFVAASASLYSASLAPRRVINSGGLPQSRYVCYKAFQLRHFRVLLVQLVDGRQQKSGSYFRHSYSRLPNMNSPVDGSWSIDPALAFDPKQLTIAHPCYPLEPVNSLESYVKAQARPTWLRAGNAHFEAFFWAQCRYDTHEQIIWRDIRTFVLDREPDANVDVVVPRSIGSFLRQEAGHQSKQPGRGARLVILDYSFVRRLLQLDAHHDRDDIRDLVRRRLPELDPQLCPLRDAQFVCTYEVDGVKGVVWFPLGYAWQKHRINVHEAEVGGEPNVDIPEATDRGTYADFLSHRAIIHLDPRPCAILLRDNSDRWNDDRCDAAVSQAANAVSCIIEMLAFDIRTDAIAAGSEPAPFNFVDDTHYAAVREDFSREALSVGYEDYTYPHHPRNFSIPRLLFLLGQRDADGGFGTLDAWVNDNIEGSVTTLFERACGGDSVTTFGNLLLGAHLHGVAPDNEVVTWPGLLALTTDVRRRAFYADEPQGLKAFQDVGVGFGLYRGYRRDLLWASIYQELVRRDAMPDQRDKSILSSMISLNTSRVDAINRIIKTYAPSTNTGKHLFVSSLRDGTDKPSPSHNLHRSRLKLGGPRASSHRVIDRRHLREGMERFRWPIPLLRGTLHAGATAWYRRSLENFAPDGCLDEYAR